MLDKRIIDQLEAASKLSSEDFYRKIAATHQASKGNVTKEILGAAGLGLLAFPFGGWALSAIAASPFLLWAGMKIMDGKQGLDEIENGNWVDCLPLKEKQRYLRDVKAIAAGTDSASMPAGKSNPPTGAIAVEDLASLLAQSTILNCIIVGGSQCGKTTFTNAALRAIAQQPSPRPFLFDGKPKPSNNWGGLKDGLQYLAVNTNDRAAIAFEMWKEIADELTRIQDGGQGVVSLPVVDEINNQRILLPKTSQEDLDKLISRFATQVQEFGGGVWLTSHSHLVEDLGFNRQMQNSFAIIALGKDGRNQSVEACIDDALIIRNRETRKALKAQLAAYQGKGAIAFTNLGGSPRIVALPDYRQPNPVPVGAGVSAPEDGDPFSLAALERALKLSLDPDTLPAELKAIHQYAQRCNDWIKARDCQRNITGFSSHSATLVREWFGQLASIGLGDTDGLGESLRYRSKG